jgi:2-amino-4-hydroxy-6-hydroxymethyldihydropteridine diphosphokinase
MSIVYLGLGTNLGDRLANLSQALQALPPAVRLEQVSPVYETSPWGYADQPDFLNLVVQAETDLPVGGLFRYLKEIEARLGRQVTFRYGPRLIDLDILFYDDLLLDTPELTIPHPRLHLRAFVLAPLADIAAELRHPGLGRTIGELLAGVDRQGVRRLDAVEYPAWSSNSFLRRTEMEDDQIKPLKHAPDPLLGYTVQRRADGGMHVVFTDLSPETLEDWRVFSLDHLLDSDRLTRNLYDLRAIREVPPQAVEVARELNSDPSARNIRLAVVVANPAVHQAVQSIADLTTPGGVEMRIFTDIEEAETWLDRPIHLLA